jgi:5'-nucleotidase
MKKIVYVDMDGVLFDFRAGVGRPDHEDDPPEMFQPGFYRKLPVMPGAKEAVQALLVHDKIDLYIATKPTTKALTCPSEKYQAIEEHFPELLRKIFMICDKGHLNGHYLIDDYPHWGAKFQGTFLLFNEKDPLTSWQQILAYMAKYK